MMDFEDIRYKIKRKKSKLMFLGSVVVFILVAILVIKVFGIKLNYNTNGQQILSNKYVLANNILGASKNGTVNLYDIETGEIISNTKIDGSNFIYSYSPNMKFMYAYDNDGKKLYSVKAKTKKITVSEIKQVNLNKKEIVDFKYSDGYFVGLLQNKQSLIVFDTKKSKEVVIDFKLTTFINNYEIVDKNVVFTSGNYICTAKLKDGKGKRINMGALSNSINVFGKNVFVHNSFGQDRNKSILLDINYETLYINKVYQFKDSKVNILKGNINNDLLYYTEIFLTSTVGNVKQVFKSIGKDMKNPSAILKHTSENNIDKTNSYGCLGYIYHRNIDELEIFNLRSGKKEYNIKVHDDFYMPKY